MKTLDHKAELERADPADEGCGTGLESYQNSGNDRCSAGSVQLARVRYAEVASVSASEIYVKKTDVHASNATETIAAGRQSRAGKMSDGGIEMDSDVAGDDREQRHKKRMKKQKALVDARIAAAQRQRGIVVLHTGNGKGKSTAAFGIVARALGHDMRVAVIQFIKGSIESGEERFYARFPDEIRFHVMGEGYTWDTQDRTRDVQTAERGWQQALPYLRDPEFSIVVLDELNIALKMGYLSVDRVLDDLRARPSHQHVVITGRGALPALIEFADTVTDHRLVKHAFDAGIEAQPGIEL